MNILALDTCLSVCAVAVVVGDEPAAVIVEAMSRGHQERLGGMVSEAMAQAGLGFDAVDRIAVTVGPGSFTGLRVGLAFAKGLALASGRPCIGIGSLEALAVSEDTDGLVAACLDAGRDQIYLQTFADGRATMPPEVLPTQEAVTRLSAFFAGARGRLVGTGVVMLASAASGAEIIPRTAADPVAIARLAARAAPPFAPPAPLYLRPPDARPTRP